MKQKVVSKLFILFILAALIFPQGAQAQGEEPPVIEGTSPFQQELQDVLAQRAEDGQPLPSSVTYEYEVNEPMRIMSMRSAGQEQQDQSVTITATTTIMFDNPQQAGYDAWPSLDPEGVEMPTSFNDLYYQKMEEEFPGYWETYEFGQEPRQETFVETFTLASPTQELPLMQSNTANTTGPNDILMGFTYAGPSIDYTLKFNEQACFLPAEKPWWWLGDWNPCVTLIDIKAGFQLEFAFGLRLPATATLQGPDQMQPGVPATFSATLTPANWSADQYTQATVAPLDGKEYVLKAHYFLGVDVTIMNINVCEAIDNLSAFSCALSEGINQSEDFVMPFGANSSFPIDDMDIPIKELGLSELYKNKTQNSGSLTSGMTDEEKDAYYDFLDKLLSLEVGIGMRPEITSTKITAHWSGVEGSDCAGEGDITFTQPDVPVEFNVTACNVGTTQDASVRLSDFRYYFNQFGITVDAYLKLKALGSIEIPLRLDLFTVDLSQWTQDTQLYLGKHQQCELKVGIVDDKPAVSQDCGPMGPDNELTLSIPTVDLVPPTSSILHNGTVGNNGWYTSDVDITLSAVDNLPGCTDPVSNIQYRLNNGLWTNYTDPFTFDQEGLTAIDFYATDEAGNSEAPQTQLVKMDKTPPQLSAARIPPSNSYGWNRTDVTIHFDARDVVSGLDTVAPDQLFTMEGAGQSSAGTATDMAGNSTTLIVTNINIDKTRPDLTVTSPQAGLYTNTSSFIAAWAASDDLSGIASEIGMMDGQPVQNGQVVDLLLMSAGSHPFAVNVVDKADNASQVSVPVFITVDINGLIAVKNKLCSIGWINKPGVCNSLGVKLMAAKDAIDRGNVKTAINILNAFQDAVNAQTGKSVQERAAHLLLLDSAYVSEELSR